MKAKKWLSDILKSFEGDLDFRLETLILELTESISKRMKEKNINRTQLAKLLNVSPPAITKILNGTSNFTLRTLLSIANTLNLDLDVNFREKNVKGWSAIHMPSATGTFLDFDRKVRSIPNAYSDVATPMNDGGGWADGLTLKDAA
jgi:transcriptional regulator with XRE-family HTH domain